MFGKIAPGEITEFSNWKDIARLVYKNSKKNITMYRSVVSFDETTSEELRLTDQKAWQRYIDNHILTIAQKNGIKVQYLQWASAVHKEKGHPHIHVVFWDISSRVKNPYTHPAIPNTIRRQMIKDTFQDKIRTYGEEKNTATAEIRQLSDALVDDFDRHIRQIEAKKYKRIREEYDTEKEISDTFDFDNKILEETAEHVFRIKSALQEHGRIVYQLLPLSVKKQVDTLVGVLLKNIPSLQKQKDNYVQSKMNLTVLYGGSEDYLNSMKDKFGFEADKIIANRILGMVKTLNRLDGEMRIAEWRNNCNQFYMEQMLLECFSMLSDLTKACDRKYENKFGNTSSELSKEARRELYLQYRDKGYEH